MERRERVIAKQMKKKALLMTMVCLAFGASFASIPVYAEETKTESQENSDSDYTISDDKLDAIKDEELKEMVKNNPLTEENVEKGKTIWVKIVDAVIPFIKSFLLALFDFFVAIGRAIIDGINSI